MHASATSQAPALGRQIRDDGRGEHTPLVVPPAATEQAWQSVGSPPPHALVQQTPSTIESMDGDGATCTQPVCAIAIAPSERPATQAVLGLWNNKCYWKWTAGA